MSKEHLILLSIYLILIGILCFRISVHSLHYTTPDSIAYLAQSEVILKTWQKADSLLSIFDIKKKFTIWPIGYPLLISLIAWLTGSSVLIASKIVNFIFLGFIFLLLIRWFRQKIWFLAISFFSYGSLEVLSQTWSETPFIFLVLLLVFFLQTRNNSSSLQLFIQLSCVLIGLFLIRYVGVIYITFIGIIGLIYLFKKQIHQAIIYLGAAGVASIIVLSYFYHNSLVSGYSTGISRINLGHQEVGMFFKGFIQGIFNEFCIARNYFFDSKPPDILFITLLGLEFILIGFVIYQKIKTKHIFKFNKNQKQLFTIAGVYLIGIITLKVFIPIDKFDYRILFPFTVPIMIGLFSWLIHENQQVFWQKTKKVIILFMLLSLLVNLPKNYIIYELFSF